MKKTIFTLFFGTLLMTSLFAKGSDVVLSSSSFQEKETINAQGERSVHLVPVAKIVPGDTVIYKNNISNHGEKSARDLVITNPIPANMEYVEHSGYCQEAQGCIIKFSIDGGKTFKRRNNLKVKSKSGEVHLAEAKDITTLQWTLKKLPNGSDSYVAFKAKLK